MAWNFIKSLATFAFGCWHNNMWEKSFPITFHQMKIVHSITKDDKTWKKVLYNHSLSNLPIAQNKIKFMKKMHQSNFVNWRGTVKSNLSVIKSTESKCISKKTTGSDHHCTFLSFFEKNYNDWIKCKLSKSRFKWKGLSSIKKFLNLY